MSIESISGMNHEEGETPRMAEEVLHEAKEDINIKRRGVGQRLRSVGAALGMFSAFSGSAHAETDQPASSTNLDQRPVAADFSSMNSKQFSDYQRLSFEETKVFLKKVNSEAERLKGEVMKDLESASSKGLIGMLSIENQQLVNNIIKKNKEGNSDAGIFLPDVLKACFELSLFETMERTKNVALTGNARMEWLKNNKVGLGALDGDSEQDVKDGNLELINEAKKVLELK